MLNVFDTNIYNVYYTRTPKNLGYINEEGFCENMIKMNMHRNIILPLIYEEIV